MKLYYIAFTLIVLECAISWGQDIKEEARCAYDVSRLNFDLPINDNGESWILAKINPDRIYAGACDTRTFVDPLDHKEKPLTGANGGLISPVVGICQVISIFKGNVLPKEFVYAWAEPAFFTTTIDNGSRAILPSPIECFKTGGGLFLCRFDGAAQGWARFSEAYDIPEGSKDFVIEAFRVSAKGSGLFDEKLAEHNVDQLTGLLSGGNPFVACMAGRLLAIHGHVPALLEVLCAKRDYRDAVFIILALKYGDAAMAKKIDEKLQKEIATAASTSELHPAAVGAYAVDATGDNDIEIRIAGRILFYVRQRQRELQSRHAATQDTYLDPTWRIAAGSTLPPIK